MDELLRRAQSAIDRAARLSQAYAAEVEELSSPRNAPGEASQQAISSTQERDGELNSAAQSTAWPASSAGSLSSNQAPAQEALSAYRRSILTLHAAAAAASNSAPPPQSHAPSRSTPHITAPHADSPPVDPPTASPASRLHPPTATTTPSHEPSNSASPAGASASTSASGAVFSTTPSSRAADQASVGPLALSPSAASTSATADPGGGLTAPAASTSGATGPSGGVIGPPAPRPFVASTSRAADPSGGGITPLAPALLPLAVLVERVAELQVEQASTMRHLLGLRLKQLRLRSQQLSALRSLLRGETDYLEHMPWQARTVAHAVRLLELCLGQVAAVAGELAGVASPAQAAAVGERVACVEGRSQEVSDLARQLLAVLRDLYRQQLGAVLACSRREHAIARLPLALCRAGSAAEGETCSICLAACAPGDALRSLQCGHFHHQGCLDEWLRIRPCCPICKLEMSPE